MAESLVTPEQLRETQAYLASPRGEDQDDQDWSQTFLCHAIVGYCWDTTEYRYQNEQSLKLKKLMWEFGLTDFSGDLTFRLRDYYRAIDSDNYYKYSQSIRFMFLELMILVLEDENG